VRVKGGTGGQLSAEGGMGRDHQVFFFYSSSCLDCVFFSLARFHRTAIFAPSSIAASLLHVSGAVRFSSPSFSVLAENLSIFFWGFFLVRLVRVV
jgi:hypothetical protein